MRVLFALCCFLFSVSNCYCQDHLAIIVIGYNRPEYLAEVLKSLHKNPESQELPIYFFFDGGKNSSQADNLAIAKSFSFPYAHYCLREKNYGCPKNIIDARRKIFDELGYRKALILEDDQVLSPNYIRFILSLYEWSQANLQNVGIVSGWNLCHLSYEQKKAHLNEVTFTDVNLWAYLIDKDCWDLIKPILYEYESLFLRSGGRAHHNNGKNIRQWIRKKVKKSYRYRIDKDSPRLLTLNIFDEHYPIGQDGLCWVAMWLNNLSQISPIVNRSKNIGRIGLNSTEELYNRHLEKIRLDCFEEDDSITTFTLLRR